MSIGTKAGLKADYDYYDQFTANIVIPYLMMTMSKNLTLALQSIN